MPDENNTPGDNATIEFVREEDTSFSVTSSANRSGTNKPKYWGEYKKHLKNQFGTDVINGINLSWILYPPFTKLNNKESSKNPDPIPADYIEQIKKDVDHRFESRFDSDGPIKYVLKTGLSINITDKNVGVCITGDYTSGLMLDSKVYEYDTTPARITPEVDRIQKDAGINFQESSTQEWLNNTEDWTIEEQMSHDEPTRLSKKNPTVVEGLMSVAVYPFFSVSGPPKQYITHSVGEYRRE